MIEKSNLNETGFIASYSLCQDSHSGKSLRELFISQSQSQAELNRITYMLS